MRRCAASRAPGTRLSRHGGPPVLLEAAAAEFSVLAQRRTRLARQLALLDRQRLAATDAMRVLEARMSHLAIHLRLSEAKPASRSAMPPVVSPVADPPPPPPPPIVAGRPALRAVASRRAGVVLEY